MEILFTKTDLDQNLIRETLSKKGNCNFLDVIKTDYFQNLQYEVGSNAVIFTSLNAVKAWEASQISLENSCPVFTVGKKAARKLISLGKNVVHSAKNAEELAEFLVQNHRNNKFVHFCSDIALNTLKIKLGEANISYEQVKVYETELLYPKIEKRYDAIAFFSPSGVRSFARHNSFADMKLFAIGNSTAEEIKKFSDSPIWASIENTSSDLLQLMAEKL